MIYTLSINQEKCLEWGITLSQGALIDAINRASSWAKSVLVDGVKYFWVSRNKLLEEIPLAYGKPDTIYRAFKDLVKRGLINHWKEGKNDMVCLTQKGKTWNVKGTTIGDAMLEGKIPSVTESDSNPSKVGNKSEKTPNNSDSNPTNNTTIYKSTSNKKTVEKNLNPSLTHHLQELNGEDMNETALEIAERVKQQVKNKKPVKTPKKPDEIWRHFFKAHNDDSDIIKMTGKDRGQLNHAYQILGKDYPDVVDGVLGSWLKFSSYVMKAKGLSNKPVKPDIGFFSKYCSEALDFTSEAAERQSESTEAPSDDNALTFPSWFQG